MATRPQIHFNATLVEPGVDLSRLSSTPASLCKGVQQETIYVNYLHASTVSYCHTVIQIVVMYMLYL